MSGSASERQANIFTVACIPKCSATGCTQNIIKAVHLPQRSVVLVTSNTTVCSCQYNCRASAGDGRDSFVALFYDYVFGIANAFLGIFIFYYFCWTDRLLRSELEQYCHQNCFHAGVYFLSSNSGDVTLFVGEQADRVFCVLSGVGEIRALRWLQLHN